MTEKILISTPILVGLTLVATIFCGFFAYEYWQEGSRLEKRNQIYESILVAQKQPNLLRVIRSAKAFFSINLHNPSMQREKEILSYYEAALGKWVALNATKPDVELNQEIEVFQNIAVRIK